MTDEKTGAPASPAKPEPKMQHCFWCGAELGRYVNLFRDPESCGSQECDRELREQGRADLEDAMERARLDGYERYR